jgi:hypothetical protein
MEGYVCDLDIGEYPPTNRIEDFWKFVQERQAIYVRYKLLGMPKNDLTADPILKKYKFTNVFRELDTGTIWQRENFREPYADHPELFFNIALYRAYNRIATAEAIGFIEDYPTSGTEQIVRDLYATGQPVFTGAYMLTGTLGGDKIHQVFNICANYLWEHRKKLEPSPWDTLREAFDRIASKVPGIGPFIAYEIISDLRWTRYLRNAKDIQRWANPGPGAKRGIKRIYNIPVRDNHSAHKDEYPSDYEGMIKVMKYLMHMLNCVKPPKFPDFEMRDIEHSLCEFDKYERVRTGEGRPRSVFNPS